MAVAGSADKFIYITGCDTGFGSILTRKLDKLGFSVVAGVYLEESIAKIKSECSSRVHPLRVDVSKEESVEKVAKEIADLLQRKAGVLHGVVNNAGILVQPGPTEWTPTSAYHAMFNVNVMGTVMTTKSLLPLLRKSQGRIVNVASIAGRVGLPTEPAYCISKYAVEGYSEVLRKDMYPWGITVHIIEPGVFKATGLYSRFTTGLDDLWNNLSDEMKKDYGEAYYKDMRKGMAEALNKGNANSELVVDAMVDALVAKSPKYRYKVGVDSKYVLSVIEKCHESVQDGLIGQVWFGKTTVATAPKNAKQIAYKRYHKDWKRFFFMLAIVMFAVKSKL